MIWIIWFILSAIDLIVFCLVGKNVDLGLGIFIILSFMAYILKDALPNKFVIKGHIIDLDFDKWLRKYINKNLDGGK